MFSFITFSIVIDNDLSSDFSIIFHLSLIEITKIINCKEITQGTAEKIVKEQEQGKNNFPHQIVDRMMNSLFVYEKLIKYIYSRYPLKEEKTLFY